jgi:hypothetical protein
MLAVKENPVRSASGSFEGTVTAEFQAAFSALEHDHAHVALTGAAGTGKSTFLRYFRQQTAKNVAVVAPTGVAALNAAGETIHSFFKLKPTFIPPEQLLRATNKKVLQQLDVLVIDEMSMVRAEVFSAVCRLLEANGRRAGEGVLLGGVQLCLVGDPFQLPPIVSEVERERFFNHFSEPGIKGSPWAKRIPWRGVRLTEVFRQSDPEFITILKQLRENGVCTTTAGYFNKRVVPVHTVPETAIILTPRNATADALNKERLAALKTKAYTYDAEASGSFTEGTGQLPAPKTLVLKPGARVMFTKNDVVERRWVNGTLGTVKHCDEDSVVVATERDGKMRHLEVSAEVWRAIRYEPGSNGTLKEKEVGKYEQLPLTLAWATTIHKAQGLTLDQVVLDATGGFFAPGHLYVALSRVRRLEDLFLKQPLPKVMSYGRF